MPAVNLDQLKLQSANLAGKISRPELFGPLFREVLTYYSNRTFRVQAVSGRSKATPSYHVPQKVIWQIERDLMPQVRLLAQDQCLEAVSILWNSPSLEEKQMASNLLGWVNADPPKMVVERFLDCHGRTADQNLMMHLSSNGSRAIRRQAPKEWETIINNWLESRRTRNLISILVAVEDSLDLEGEAYLPRAYEIMTRVLLTNDAAVLQELLHLLNVMIRKSLSETTYYVKSGFSKPEAMNQLSVRFLKRSVALFSGEAQAEIRLLVNPDTGEK